MFTFCEVFFVPTCHLSFMTFYHNILPNHLWREDREDREDMGKHYRERALPKNFLNFSFEPIQVLLISWRKFKFSNARKSASWIFIHLRVTRLLLVLFYYYYFCLLCFVLFCFVLFVCLTYNSISGYWSKHFCLVCCLSFRCSNLC